ncbi:hypothetical protein DDE82_008695 [Stemphylium lycopersici]|uniref:Uncharacterized protein n=1 Tax=Stemphylium lycopersici TaxID=183478 RepID=A0A364MSH5_STELY|nr:hypothetical protein TW65_08660 [Stemphylium lycopersici]RAQ99002.1 hypothetical protein DDE82_008695 [Stemphylium lycopersici]RAR01902.1 hypothetical protein DDE83_008762 [Stemphylium lycopersici]
MTRSSDSESSDSESSCKCRIFDEDTSDTSFSSNEDDTFIPDDEEEEDEPSFMPEFSAHEKCAGDITLSAYGRSSYALVLGQRLLKIYDPETRSILESYDLPKRAFWSPTFTSVIVHEDNFFLSISDGSMLSCWKITGGYMFAPSSDTFISGFFLTTLVRSLKPEKLLGASSNWLVYQSTLKSIYKSSRRSLVFLKSDRHISGKPTSLEAFQQEFKHDIVAHAYCSATDLLWVVTGRDQNYNLYKIDPSNRTKEKFKINPEYNLPQATILAVSNQGHVAFEDGDFVIHQPWNPTDIPERIVGVLPT